MTVDIARPPAKAWQRQIREHLAEVEGDEGIFGPYWLGVNRDISNAVVREIDQATARRIILRYEWLGCMPAVVWHCFGIFYDEVLAGVVCYGPEYSENLGKIGRASGRKMADWSRYDFEGKMILLSRGACVHWAHPHSASKLIRRSMDLLPAKYEVVTATVDESAGEIGTIYQAAGFFYVGSMREANPNVNFRRLDRQGWLIDGKIWNSRSIRQAVGNTRWEEVQRMFPQAERVRQHSKQRYFAFRGNAGVKRKHRAAIANLIKPYPKRAEGVGETSPAIQPGSAGAMPAPRSIQHRLRCEDCDNWYCGLHGGHVGELCDCVPCDACHDLYPPRDLAAFGLCRTCVAA